MNIYCNNYKFVDYIFNFYDVSISSNVPTTTNISVTMIIMSLSHFCLICNPLYHCLHSPYRCAVSVLVLSLNLDLLGVFSMGQIPSCIFIMLHNIPFGELNHFCESICG
jgi:hypothetical protein